MPQVFYRVGIRTLWWRAPPVHSILFKECLCCSRSVSGHCPAYGGDRLYTLIVEELAKEQPAGSGCTSLHPSFHRKYRFRWRHAIQFHLTHAPSQDALHEASGEVARLSSDSKTVCGTPTVQTFHPSTERSRSRPEGEHEPIQVTSLYLPGELVDSMLTLGTSNPVGVGHAGSW